MLPEQQSLSFLTSHSVDFAKKEWLLRKTPQILNKLVSAINITNLYKAPINLFI